MNSFDPIFFLALVTVALAALALHVWQLRHKRPTPHHKPVVTHLTAYCADCAHVVEQTRDGRCGTCGSEAISTRGNLYRAPVVVESPRARAVRVVRARFERRAS